MCAHRGLRQVRPAGSACKVEGSSRPAVAGWTPPCWSRPAAVRWWSPPWPAPWARTMRPRAPTACATSGRSGPGSVRSPRMPARIRTGPWRRSGRHPWWSCPVCRRLDGDHNHGATGGTRGRKLGAGAMTEAGPVRPVAPGVGRGWLGDAVTTGVTFSGAVLPELPPLTAPPLPAFPGTVERVGAVDLFVRHAPGPAGAEPALFVHGLGGASTNWTD